MRASRRAIVFLAAIAALPGCEELPEEYAVFEEESASLRALRMNIEILIDGAPVSMTTNDASQLFWVDCLSQRNHPNDSQRFPLGSSGFTSHNGAYPTESGTCLRMLGDVEASTCVARRLYELAVVPRDAPTEVSVQGYEEFYDPTVLIPLELPAEQRAGLLEMASKIARAAMEISARHLANTSGAMNTNACAGQGSTDLGGVTVDEFLAGYVQEGWMLAKRALDRAVDANTAVADSDASGGLGAEQAQAWFASSLSRAHAASLLVGGTYDPDNAQYGVGAFSEEGLCPVPAPGGRVEAARGLLMEGGILPELLLDRGVSSGSIWMDLSDWDDEYTLRHRVAAIRGTPEIAQWDTEDLETASGITMRDFDHARAIMRAEAAAFRRDLTILIPNNTQSFDRYAATSTRPAPPHPALYLSEMEYEPLDVRVGLQTFFTNPSASGYAARGFAQSVDRTLSLLAIVRDRASYLAAFPSTARHVSGLYSVMLDTQPGVVESCQIHVPGGSGWHIRALGFGQYDDLRVVPEGSLRCVLEGRVEGVACNPEQYLGDPLELVPSTWFVDSSAGYRSLRWGFVPVGDSPMHVVRRVGDVGSPRAFEYIATVHRPSVPACTPDLGYCAAACDRYPYNPELANRAAQLLVPSVDVCGAPNDSCAGISTGHRLPLEDDLSSDADPLESSWRHQLAEASAAATTADSLGEDIISAGLELERLSAAAVDNLEEICGGPIDVSAYLGDVFEGADGGPCLPAEEGEQCGGPGVYICRAGRCVRDTRALLNAQLEEGDPSLRKLAECLGESEVVELVSLGDRSGCAWRSGGALCTGADPEHPCPFEPPAEGPVDCGALAVGDYLPAGMSPSEYELVRVEGLGMFGEPEGATLTGDMADVCDAFRRHRRDGTGFDDPSRFFELLSVQEVARRVGWEARPYGHSVIKVDGADWAETGDVLTGISTTWPCGGVHPSVDAGQCEGPEDSSSLFCSYVANCGAYTDQLGRMNMRMGRAALALVLTSGVGLAEMGLPHLPDTFAANNTESSLRRMTYLPSGVVGGPHYLTVVPRPRNESGLTDIRRHKSTINGEGYCSPTVDYQIPVWWSLPRVGVEPRARYAADYWSLAPERLYSDDCDTSAYFAVERYVGSSLRGTALATVATWWEGVGGGGSAQGMMATLLNAPGRSPGEIILPIETIRHDISSSIRPTYDSGVNLPMYRDDRFYNHRNSLVGDGFTRRDVLDGLELACAVAESQVGVACTDDPPTLEDIRDYRDFRNYLSCSASRIEDRARNLLIPNVPQEAVDAVRRGLLQGGATNSEGSRGVAIRQLVAGITGMRQYPIALSGALREMSDQFGALERGLAQVNTQRQVAQLSQTSNIVGAVGGCLGGGGGAFGSLVGCASAMGQLGISMKISELEDNSLTRNETALVEDFEASMRDIADRLAEIEIGIATAEADLNAATLALENDRVRGTRELNEALLMRSDEAGRHYGVNSVQRAVYDVAVERYQEARDRAVRASYLAKLAIEQRLGMRLSQMTEPMTRVAAPSQWEAGVCTLSGFDYSDYRAGEDGVPQSQYIGDYVRRLEDVVESFRHDYPYRNGDDTMVVSLRDDIYHDRALCPAYGRNLVRASNDFRQGAVTEDNDVVMDDEEDTSVPLWERRGCGDGVELSPQQCISFYPLGNGGVLPMGSTAPIRPVPFISTELGSIQGFEVVFAEGVAVADSEDHYSGAAEVVQTVTVPAGRYLLSWYGLAGAEDVVSVRAAAGEAPITTDGIVMAGSFGAEEWPRHVIPFIAYANQDIEVVIRSPNAAWDVEHRVHIGGIQLEQEPGGGSPTTPTEFLATDQEGLSMLRVCEDTDGYVFQSRWTYFCENECDGLPGTSCGGLSVERCYWQTTFGISNRQVQSGEQLSGSGFASGNFNYRVGSFALNLVGTALVDCSMSPTPSTCYSNGGVSYSVEHLGPYEVENYDGEIYHAPLHVGRIQGGRALATERYITTPISTADSGQIGQFSSSQLMGRPLPGQYVLRLWDTPEFRMKQLQDVQVVLGYTYWTRSN